jgi:hypothetical protein
MSLEQGGEKRFRRERFEGFERNEAESTKKPEAYPL